VAGNVGYGLRRVPAENREARVKDLLQRFGLTDFAERPALQLSSGQQQRVALARSLAPNPGLLLLDEPLSALDDPARAVLRMELRSLLVQAGIPTILVTHDRSEALALGDRMAVVIDGRVRQVASVEEVFSRPVDPEVAGAVGVENVVSASVVGRANGVLLIEAAGRQLAAVDHGIELKQVLACIRAEEVILRVGGDSQDSARNHLQATVVDVIRDGPLYRVRLDCGFSLAALVTSQARDELGLVPGASVIALVKAQSIHCVPRPAALAQESMRSQA